MSSVLSVCRTCLGDNTTLHSVNNNLQSFYGKLTDTKFISEDARPQALCCYCYQKLLRCYTFSEMAVKSEKILDHLYETGLQVTHEFETEIKLDMKQHLTMAVMQFVTIECNANNAPSQLTIKKEPLPTYLDVEEEVTSSPDKLLEVETFPEDSTKSHSTFREDYSQVINKEDPLSSIDMKEEVTSNLDKWLQVESSDDSTESHLTVEDHSNVKKKDVEELVFNIHGKQTKPDDSRTPFNCNTCKKIFYLKRKLIVHIKKTHSQKAGRLSSEIEHTERTCMNEDEKNHNKKFLACHVCDEQFNQIRTLVEHMRIHTGEKLFACNVCDKQYNHKGNLVIHMRIHTGEKLFICHVCGKQFNQKSHLISHMKTHTGDKAFACNICKKQFFSKGHLVLHMKFHTDEKSTCTVCDKQFNRKYSLVLHMQTHTGEKPFACHVCGKQFKQKINLDIHMRIHTGHKLLACNVCDKQFNQSSHLVRHTRIHKDRKPFSCNVCDKQFKRKSSLVSHMRKHR